MEQLTLTQCRDRNSDKLKKSDLWITGDGTSFPATQSGQLFAAKWSRRNGLSLHYAKKTPQSRQSGGNKKSNKN